MGIPIVPLEAVVRACVPGALRLHVDLSRLAQGRYRFSAPVEGTHRRSQESARNLGARRLQPILRVVSASDEEAVSHDEANVSGWPEVVDGLLGKETIDC